MELVVLFGPPAVGKMSVGKALCEQTGFRLFHNHMFTDHLQGIIDKDAPQYKPLVKEFRQRVIEEAAKANVSGIVLTYVWAFDKPEDKETIDALCRVPGVKASFAELKTTLETRLERNRHPDRLAAKAAKRDLAASEQSLRNYEVKYKLNSNGDFYYPERYLCIDNTNIPVDETAAQIARHFKLSLKAAA